jgi:hypothetical protein
MAGVSGDGCLGCHTADIGTVSTSVKFPHEKHIAAGWDCALCHQGVSDAPHLDFAESATALPELGHEFCGTCHMGDVPGTDGIPKDAKCDLCH